MKNDERMNGFSLLHAFGIRINAHVEHTNEGATGFTLIEMITAIALFAVLMGAVSAFILTLYRTNAFAFEQSFAIENARKGITEMVQYIREADYSEEGAYPLASVATSSFTFYSDIDRDGGVEKVRYFLDGTDLKQGVTQPTGDPLGYAGPETVRVVSENVRNNAEGLTLFNYFDNTGAQVTASSGIADISFVKIALVVNVDPIRAPKDFELTSSAALRNLKTNL